MIVNILNPKTALFFLAFLPQFVDPDRGAVCAAGRVPRHAVRARRACCPTWRTRSLADAIAGRLRRSGTGAKLRRWLSGGIFIALGITAAAARRTT